MIEQNKAAIRQFISTVFNDHEVSRAGDFFAADFRDHSPWPEMPATVEGFKQGLRSMLEAFPDMTYEIEDLVAEGDLVAIRGALRGTHRGQFIGQPPTGKRVTVPLLDIIRLVDGKMAEHWGETDTMAMMQQLGLAPPQ